MRNLIIGIDISKDNFDFCMLQSVDHAIIKRGIVENTKNDISKWLKKLDPAANSIFYGAHRPL